MKTYIVAFALVIAALACTKEQPESYNKEQDASATEIEALKKEVAELKAQLEQLTKIDDLEGKINGLTSDYFEVDGLRFDKNGEIISTPKKKDSLTEDDGRSSVTVTRTKDAQGRLVEYYEEYLKAYNGNYASYSGPYLWKRITYEYNGKTCKVTTQTHDYALSAESPANPPVITEITYW